MNLNVEQNWINAKLSLTEQYFIFGSYTALYSSTVQ